MPPNVVRAVDSSPEGLDLAEPGAVLEITDGNYNSDEDEEEENDPEEDNRHRS